ncbi:hypothetical protein DUNSADRAFT_17941 [Dunaliella salina]|uniref:Uncharacterized protein n=1 Tax=Dunaliella salina TaxID=3046 RepID=A0ABQ7H931_DUNSA|nr:hypothetical protein DUNSADRAFT_17941 [Dunaliella salina]|eukprot:KAF5843363.1 hypothetical protein DUNSADRAFT_17941 [Dunaliella salina]
MRHPRSSRRHAGGSIRRSPGGSYSPEPRGAAGYGGSGASMQGKLPGAESDADQEEGEIEEGEVGTVSPPPLPHHHGRSGYKAHVRRERSPGGIRDQEYHRRGYGGFRDSSRRGEYSNGGPAAVRGGRGGPRGGFRGGPRYRGFEEEELYGAPMGGWERGRGRMGGPGRGGRGRGRGGYAPGGPSVYGGPRGAPIPAPMAGYEDYGEEFYPEDEFYGGESEAMMAMMMQAMMMQGGLMGGDGMGQDGMGGEYDDLGEEGYYEEG